MQHSKLSLHVRVLLILGLSIGRAGGEATLDHIELFYFLLCKSVLSLQIVNFILQVVLHVVDASSLTVEFSVPVSLADE